MATVKKVNKYREGGDIPCPNGKCKPSKSRSPKSPVGANTSGGRGRGNVVTQGDIDAGRKQRLGERIMSSAKKIVPQSTAPGVRDAKKGSQSLFGGDKDVNEAKYGKKVAPKVPNSRPKDNYMKEADTKLRLKSPQWPMKQKRLSK
jgi:hypothetical protein